MMSSTIPARSHDAVGFAFMIPLPDPAPRALSPGAVVAIFATLAVIAIIVIALASGR